MAWFGRDLKNHLVLTSLPQAGLPTTRPSTVKNMHQCAASIQQTPFWLVVGPSIGWVIYSCMDFCFNNFISVAITGRSLWNNPLFQVNLSARDLFQKIKQPIEQKCSLSVEQCSSGVVVLLGEAGRLQPLPPDTCCHLAWELTVIPK